jgi:arylsulfatase A-like enzyme
MAFDFRTNRTSVLARAAGFALMLALAACSKPKTAAVEPRQAGETRPDVLLIVVDHLGPEFAAYGDRTAATPNLDRLAREGVTFTNFYAASGSEDAEAAALLTGMSPHAIGVVQEWTGQAPAWTAAPPPEVKGFPELMRAAGWRTFHVGGRADPFGSPASLWEQDRREPGATWPDATIGRPFLGQIDLTTLSVAGEKPAKKGFLGLFGVGRADAAEPKVRPIDARTLTVPAWLPDTPAVRAALKKRYEAIERVDAQIGEVLDRLHKTGLDKTTVVVLTAKTGPALPRAERTLYDSGVRVPLIVRRPDGRGAGTVRRDLVSGVDFAPSMLRLAGLPPLAWMQGRDRLDGPAEPARYVFSVQNRVDGVYERAFAVRDGRWLYIRNLAFEAPLAALARRGDALDAVNGARRGGKLSPAQARLFGDRPEDELYDLQKDPAQLVDLADDPAHAGDVERLSAALNAYAAGAPDFSTYTTEDLRDLYRPAGETPAAAQPSGRLLDGRVVLETVTPGASILWRIADDQPWRLYTGPIPKAETVQAKASRYGFAESTVAQLKFKK